LLLLFSLCLWSSCCSLSFSFEPVSSCFLFPVACFLLPCFLLDNKPSRQRDAFKPVSFEQNKLSALLQGSKHEGEGLVLARTRYLRDFFKEPNMNGFPKQFWFAGTSNPLVGAATVLGGGGNVGSYLGTYSFLAFLSIFHFP
jgi:hypothetical protein